jgi:Putative Ig domain
MIYYADLGKSGTGDGSFGNQYGKDQWDTIDPASLGASALQIQGEATYTRDILVCGLNTISKWPLITSQDPATPFRINAPGYTVQFNQPSPQYFQGTNQLSHAIIYCHDIALPASDNCFFCVDGSWLFPGGIGGTVFQNIIVYLLSTYLPFTDPYGTIKNSLIYELATGYHLLQTGGILDTVLTNDTNLVGLTDGSWTDSGTIYNFSIQGGTPSGWDDTNLYNFSLGASPAYIPAWAVIAPSNLTYSTNPVNYPINVMIATNTPSHDGGSAVVSYVIDHSLPTGLSFNTTTGLITGTPTVVSISDTYVITATNSAGSTNCNLVLSVYDPNAIDRFDIGIDWLKHPSQGLEPFRTPIQYPGSGIRLRNISDEIQIKFTASFTNMTKAIENNLLSYFNNHKGRLNAFWAPVPKNYFFATADIGASDTTIQIEDVSPIWLRGYERMFILDQFGNFYHAKINNLTPSTMTIDSSLGANILKSDISMFGKLIWARFDMDEVQMHYISPGISECDLSFIELPKEYV